MKEQLQSENIFKLILKFSVPSMIAILVNTLYNIIDRIFIGQYDGADALAGLTMVYPIMLVIFAGSALIGRGGANLISIMLGQKDSKNGSKVFTTTIVITVLFASIMSVIGFVSLRPILGLLGASGDVLTSGYQYMSIIYMGVIFWVLSFTLSCTVRAEGQAMLSMVAMVVSALINTLLDYIFVVQLSWGVRGAAFATIIAQFIGFVILISYYLNNNSIKFEKKYIKPDWSIVRRLFSVGLPSYFVTVGSGISLMVLNRYLGIYGGVGAVASIGAIGSLMSFFNIPVSGIQNGIQPIIAYNHGAGDNDRIRQTVFQSILITLIAGSLTFILVRYEAANLMSLFIRDQHEYIQVGAQGLKIYSFLIPLTGIINISIAYLQSIEEPLYATFISLSRQIVILIPMIMLFSNIWGLDGVWYAVPVADGISILISVSIIIRQHIKIKKVKSSYI